MGNQINESFVRTVAEGVVNEFSVYKRLHGDADIVYYGPGNITAYVKYIENADGSNDPDHVMMEVCMNGRGSKMETVQIAYDKDGKSGVFVPIINRVVTFDEFTACEDECGIDITESNVKDMIRETVERVQKRMNESLHEPDHTISIEAGAVFFDPNNPRGFGYNYSKNCFVDISNNKILTGDVYNRIKIFDDGAASLISLLLNIFNAHVHWDMFRGGHIGPLDIKWPYVNLSDVRSIERDPYMNSQLDGMISYYNQKAEEANNPRDISNDAIRREKDGVTAD